MDPVQYDNRYTEYQTNRSAIRKFVRKIYLRKARKYLRGKVVDLGCGIGELLSTLPQGSMGLEYNQDTVKFCQSNGLNVQWYDGFNDGWKLSAVSGNEFESLVISHVLEHFENPMNILSDLLDGCTNKGIKRVLVIVPGKSGYASDSTHLTFVDKQMLENHMKSVPSWKIDHAQYFPVDARFVGDHFTHHELQMLLTRS